MRPLALTLFLLVAATGASAQQLNTTIVPVVGSVVGPDRIRWKTDLEIVNEGSFEADVALELVAAPSAPAMILTLGPGQVQRFTDVVGQAFGMDAILSPLRVTTIDRRAVTVRARAYAIRGSEVLPMQPIDVFRSGSSHPFRILDGLAFSESTRTNIGLLNLGERPAEFILALQRLPGRNVAVTQVRVEPGVLLHFAIQQVFPLITEGYGFGVLVESSGPETFVYASVIESENHAGRFVAPRIGSR